jgi:hypothetical protein
MPPGKGYPGLQVEKKGGKKGGKNGGKKGIKRGK